MNKQRSLSVDIAKGIAIIAIVLGHINFAYPHLTLVMTEDFLFRLWHVPIFFILGGFFIREEQLNQPVSWFNKKFFSLYLKILYFYIPAILLHNVFINIGWYLISFTDPIINVYSITDFIKHILLTICLAGREPIGRRPISASGVTQLNHSAKPPLVPSFSGCVAYGMACSSRSNGML